MARLFRIVSRYFTALFGAIYAFTIGFVSASNRRLVYSIAEHFRAPEPVPPLIPEIAVEELVSDSIEVRICQPTTMPGNTSALELIVLAKLVSKHQPKRILEIGTFDGRTTLNLAANSPPDARVFTLDLPREQIAATEYTLLESDRGHVDKSESGLRFHGTAYEGKIRQLYGDSANFDFSEYLGNIDFVFVDGSHAYEYVLADTRTALKLIGERTGVIVWHDYGGVYDFAGVADVTRALNKLYSVDNRLKVSRRVAGTTLTVAELSQAAKN